MNFFIINLKVSNKNHSLMVTVYKCGNYEHFYGSEKYVRLS